MSNVITTLVGEELEGDHENGWELWPVITAPFMEFHTVLVG